MKILMVIGDMDRGGAQTHVYELSKKLAAFGNSVTVMSSGGRLAEPLVSAGVAHVCAPLDSKRPLNILRCVLILKKFISDGGADIVHAHTRESAFLAFSVCRRLGIPLVTTVHANYRPNAILDRLARWGRAQIAVSEDLERYLLLNGKNVFSENVSVIPNGIDTDRFSPTDIGGRDRRIVFASRMDKDCSRAAYALVEIAEELYAEYPDVEIVLCGGGDAFGEIRERAERVNGRIGKMVISVTGYVDGMETVLQSAGVFVGVSRAALEAMACGVPVILGGNEGYIGRVTVENLSLCESSNFCCRGEAELTSERLFADILSVLELSADDRKALGRVNRELVLRYHSSILTARKVEAFYKKYARSDKRTGKSVLLCGYYGYGNMGDDAMLLRAIQRAEERFPHLRICVMTANGKKDSQRFGVDCRNRYAILTLIREIRKSDAVVFGGGTLLQNSTSYRSLAYYLFVLHYAQTRGKRTELWGNGIGGVKGKIWRARTAEVLSECSLVGLRDRESLYILSDLINEHGLKLPCFKLETDLAFAPFSGDKGKELYFSKLSENKRHAVVVLKGNEKKEQVEILVDWLKRLMADGIVLVFVVMYPKEDMRLCKRICGELGGVFAYPLGISDISELIRSSYIVCSMRYHALVFARSVGTPFIGFGASEKIRRFCDCYGGVYVDK